MPDSPLGIAPTRTSQADSQELVAFALGTGHVVAYRPELARALGSAVAAIFLGQAIYWQRIAGIGQWFISFATPKEMAMEPYFRLPTRTNNLGNGS